MRGVGSVLSAVKAISPFAILGGSAVQIEMERVMTRAWLRTVEGGKAIDS